MRVLSFAAATVLAVAVLASSCDGVGAADKEKTKKKVKKAVTLKVGDKAPVFNSVDENGKKWRSKDFVGKKILVVWFYPAALTGGWTKQACGFRDDLSKLKGLDVEVIGVSGDKPENQKLFKKINKLTYTLLADEKGKVARKFGVPLRDGGTIKKEIDGKVFDLIRGVTPGRCTFVIGKDGKVAHINMKVKAAEDSQNILKVLQKLKKKESSSK